MRRFGGKSQAQGISGYWDLSHDHGCLQPSQGFAPTGNTPTKRNDPERAASEALRLHQEREKTYRERALKIHPWICAWCGREFFGKKVKELTVHHKDFDHENNPPDGSNWELLCIYCHEQVHARKFQWGNGTSLPIREEKPLGTFRPFAHLKSLLNPQEDDDS